MFLSEVFIGSSSEGLRVAHCISNHLKCVATTKVWDSDIFRLSHGTLETLVDELDRYDFAILVLTPDDDLESRNQVFQSPRDNVLFECGLFMGRLGRKRTFIVYEKNVKIPSDLAGITLAQYELDQNSDLEISLRATCDKIIAEIKKQRYLPSRKVDGVEIGKFPFRDVFGKDVFFSGAFHLIYAQLALVPARDEYGKQITHPYIKPGDRESNSTFSIERPISSCEVRAAKYLSGAIGREAKAGPALSSDIELQSDLDLSFIAFGGPLSNYKSRDVMDNGGNNILKFDNYKFFIPETNEVVVTPEAGFDYGLILKIHPNQFKARNWFACAGIGEWGTSGAAWYLANKWKEIQEYAGEAPFGIVVRVKLEQDESVEFVYRVRGDT